MTMLAASKKAKQHHRTASAIAAVVMGLTLAAAGVGAVAALLWGQSSYATWFVPAAVAASCIGALIARRRPENAVGWLLMVQGVVFAAPAVTQTAVLRGATIGDHSHFIAWMAWGTDLLIDVSVLPLALALILFPDGHLPRPRWRWLIWLLCVTTAMAVGLDATSNLNPWGMLDNLTHPLTLVSSGPLLSAVFSTSVMVSYLGLVFAAAALVSRFRRSGDLVRQQIKWVAWAGAILAAGFVVGLFFVPLVVGGEPQTVWVFAAGAPLVMVSIGIALQRYRLYDIDRLISRTTSYAIVSAVILATYGVVVTVVLQLLPDSSNLAVAAATLAAAAVARPAVRQVQSVVDRRFDRTKYDGQQAAQAFGTRLGREVDPAAVIRDLRGVVAATVQPASLQVWVREAA